MSKRKIYITEQDMGRLRELLRSTKDPFGMDRSYLATLRAELDRAEIVAAGAIEDDVVTMNSTVRVRDYNCDRTTTLTLVFPENANPQEDRISVIAPLGAALLGYRVGDQVSFKLPTGMRMCEIVEVLYQPEAAGDLHL
jgi:regulator of nucleoside diphosphate kinase